MLKMEVLLVDQEHWVFVDPKTTLIGIMKEDLEKLKKKSKDYYSTLSFIINIVECLRRIHYKKLWD